MNKYLLTLREQRDIGNDFEIEIEAHNADDAIRQGNLLYERDTPKSIVTNVRPIASPLDGLVIKKPADEIEMPTPFANVIIKIAEKDLWAKEDIGKWVFKKCGIPTEEDIRETNWKFEMMKRKCKDKLNWLSL